MDEPDALAHDLDGRFRAGDPDALRAVWQRWGGMVHRLCAGSLGASDADDVTQQVFIDAWRRRDRFDPTRGPIPAWLVGIARHRIADHRRARRPASVNVVGDAAVPDHVDALADRLLVTDALGQLPPLQRAVLELVYRADLPHHEVAAQLGMPLGTVKSHLARGLQRLRAAAEVGRDAPELVAADPAAAG